VQVGVRALQLRAHLQAVARGLHVFHVRKLADGGLDQVEGLGGRKRDLHPAAMPGRKRGRVDAVGDQLHAPGVRERDDRLVEQRHHHGDAEDPVRAVMEDDLPQDQDDDPGRAPGEEVPKDEEEGGHGGRIATRARTHLPVPTK
jgi:hypothetical protein